MNCTSSPSILHNNAYHWCRGHFLDTVSSDKQHGLFTDTATRLPTFQRTHNNVDGLRYWTVSAQICRNHRPWQWCSTSFTRKIIFAATIARELFLEFVNISFAKVDQVLWVPSKIGKTHAKALVCRCGTPSQLHCPVGRQCDGHESLLWQQGN